MKRGKKILLVIVAALLVTAAALTLWNSRTMVLIRESGDTPLTVSSVRVGTGGEDVSQSVDLAAVERLLLDSQGTGGLFPSGRSSISQTEDVIQIDGTDAKGPVHVVLSQTEGYLYRSGVERRVSIVQWQALYESVRSLLESN